MLPTTRSMERLALDTDASLGSAVPSLWGVPLKYLSLVTLAVQNSALTIIMHYSRVSTPPSQAYLAATAVLMNEILKGAISFAFAYSRIDTASIPDASFAQRAAFRWRKVIREVLSPDCWKLSIPASLYVIQNNLQYVAASNLDVATFQVSYQMKILTTAVFSVLLLRKKLYANQWIALVCLAVGVGVVQIQAATDGSSGAGHAAVQSMNPAKGFLAVAAACFTSGLAGVYFEMVLKNSQADLWVRNVQLSFFSLLPAILPILVHLQSQDPQGGQTILSSLFQNFGGWAWATVLTQVFGGLITALVIKYSDNILKGFATSLSIVLSFLASVALFNFKLTITFVLGSTIVLISTWLYNQPPKKTGNTTVDSWIMLRSEKTKDHEALLSPHAVEGSFDAISSTSTSIAPSPIGTPCVDESKTFTFR